MRRNRDLWGVFTLALIIAVVRRLRASRAMQRPPWVLLSSGAGLGVVASIGYHYPSWQDFVSYGAYALLLASMRSFQQHRDAKPDRDARLDALIVMAATSVLVYAAILSHYLRDGRISGVERGGNLIYSVLTISLVTLTARLAVGGGRRNTAWSLLAITVALVVANDFLIMLQTAGNVWAFDASTYFAPLAPLFATAAVLHPDADELTHDPGVAPSTLSRTRLLMLGGALLIIPAVLLASQLRGAAPDYPVLIGGAVVLALLALGRLTRLFRTQEAATATETVLREAGARLLSAPSRSEITNAAQESAERIMARTEGVAVLVMSRDSGDDQTLLDAVTRALDGSAQTTQADAACRNRLGLDPFCEIVLTAIDDAADPVGAIVVSSPTSATEEDCRALLGLASQVALAYRNEELTARLAASRVERRFRSLIENSSDIVVILDAQGIVSFVSPAVNHVLGRPESDIVGQQLLAIADAQDHRSIERTLSWAVRGGTSPLPIEARLLAADQESRWFELVWRDLRHDAEINGLVVNAREITDRKVADERMSRSEARFRALVQHSTDMVLVVDSLGFVQYVSPSVPHVFGVRSDSLLGVPIVELLGPDFGAMTPTMAQPFEKLEMEIVTTDASGGRLELVLTVSDLRQEPAVGGIVVNGRDVTLHRSLQEDLRRRASEDELTGLANRAALVVDITARIRDPRRGGAGVLIIDLDDFKTINDGLGTAAGDEILATVAGRIRANLRQGDEAARLAGDEFAVLIDDIASTEELIALGDRLIEVISTPMMLGGETVLVSSSVGAVEVRLDATADELLRDGDTALHIAKKAGKRRVTLFETHMREDASDRYELRSGLRRGIFYGELVDLYQPKVWLLNDRISGAEVLVRWQHPERGLLGPNSFIPLAEETGLIIPLGQWVLEQATSRLLRWNSMLPPDRQLDVSVNVSARQLEQPEAVDAMIETVDRLGADPRLIVLELTESLFVSENSVQREQIERLYAHGFRVSVDDFGTGYSSLRYLEQLSINEIKIDRSFIEGVDRSANKRAVLARIVELASDLGYSTVAEGIEGGAELEIVRSVGCDYGQGYFFSRPIAPERFEDLVDLSAGRFSRTS